MGTFISLYKISMRIIARRTLREFWNKYPDSQKSLILWFKKVEAARWDNPKDLKKQFSIASILNDNRVVFNIKGNKYRVVVRINYELKILWIRFIGTHTEYDKIDATNI